jgi:hypothetical protein
MTKAKFQNDDFMKFYVAMMDEFKKLREENDARFDKVDGRLGRIEQTLDYLAGEYKNLSDDNDANAHATRRVDDTLENHEERIGNLETLRFDSQSA